VPSLARRISARPLPEVSAQLVTNRRKSNPDCQRLASRFRSWAMGWPSMTVPSSRSTRIGRRAMSVESSWTARTTAGSVDGSTVGVVAPDCQTTTVGFTAKMRENHVTLRIGTKRPDLSSGFQESGTMDLRLHLSAYLSAYLNQSGRHSPQARSPP
jgi:hypothetical protein